MLRGCGAPLLGDGGSVIVALGTQCHPGHLACAHCGDAIDVEAAAGFYERGGCAYDAACFGELFCAACTACGGRILDAVARWEQPLDIAGFVCPGGGSLYPYQTFTLNRALERAHAPRPDERLMFVGWATGTGKSCFAAAGAQEMVNRGLVDVILAFTLGPLKTNLARFISSTTTLDAVVNDGSKPKRAMRTFFSETI